MTVRNSKKTAQLPFTQFWYNLSKQLDRQTKNNTNKAGKNSGKNKANQNVQMNINNYHGEGSGSGYRDGFGNDIGKGKNNGHGKGSKDRRLSLNQYKTGDARKSFPSNPTTNNINNKQKQKQHKQTRQQKFKTYHDQDHHREYSMFQNSSNLANYNYNDNYGDYTSSFIDNSINNISNNNNISSSNQNNSNKGKVSDKILQIIQNNVIPFLVEKFVEIQEKINGKIKKLEGTLQVQAQEIIRLKSNQEEIKQRMELFRNMLVEKEQRDKEKQKQRQRQKDKDKDKYIDKHKQNEKSLYINGTSPVTSQKSSKKRLHKYPNINAHSSCKCKILVQVGNSPMKLPQINSISNSNNNRFLEQRTSEQLCSRIMTDPHEENIRQLGTLIQQLTSTVDESGTRNEELINNLQKQLKKLSQRQKISEQKLEKEFAQKILDLISTYNDNFVDLDKRVVGIQEIIAMNNLFGNKSSRFGIGL